MIKLTFPLKYEFSLHLWISREEQSTLVTGEGREIHLSAIILEQNREGVWGQCLRMQTFTKLAWFCSTFAAPCTRCLWVWNFCGILFPGESFPSPAEYRDGPGVEEVIMCPQLFWISPYADFYLILLLQRHNCPHLCGYYMPSRTDSNGLASHFFPLRVCEDDPFLYALRPAFFFQNHFEPILSTFFFSLVFFIFVGQ